MEDYDSKYEGAEVDALLDKAGTAVQPNNLAAVATSGSYNDLVDTPTIPAEQVNADWNATSGKAQILNKPTIPAAVTESTVSGWGFIKSAAYALVNHGTSNTTFTLQPNTFYVWGTVTKLTLTLGSEVSGVANEYLFQFTSGSTATTLSLPSSIKWQEDLTIEKNKTYQVSILNGFATVLAF